MDPILIHPLKDTAETGNAMYVMRDDLIPRALGGNKVRIAGEFLADMKRRGSDCMVAYGNVRSNLCRVLALECCRLHIPCHVICTREETDAPAQVTANTHLMELAGAVLHPCEKNGIAAAVSGLMEALRGQGYFPYYIYGNQYGTGNEGTPAMAYAKTWPALLAWERANGVTFDYLFHASGTGATQAGLTCGHILSGDQTKVCGVLISSRPWERAMGIIEDAMEGCFAGLGEAAPPRFRDEICLLGAYTAGGYGVSSPDILACIRRELRDNSLPLDPTYTGKAFLGMQRYLLENRITGKNVLFLHTGGTPLFYDSLPQLDADARSER